MLARSYRFHGHTSLRYVYGRGQVVRGPIGLLKYAPNNRRTCWRAAVVVSRKVHKSAVVRNRIRRRLYEIMRQTLPADGPVFDIVLIIQSETVATMPAAELRIIAADMLAEAGLTPVKRAIV